MRPGKASMASSSTVPEDSPEVSGSNTEKISFHFSQSQLSLALFFAKSKPKHIPMTEHLEQLKTNIQTIEGTTRGPVRRVDTVEYWKDQYETIHQENVKLEDEVQSLEENLRQLKRKFSSDGEGVGNDYMDLHIPKHDPVAGRASKQKLTSFESIAEKLNRQAGYDQTLNMSNYIPRIGRQRMEVEAASRSGDNLAQINEISNCTRRMLLLIERVLFDCTTPLQFYRDNEDMPVLATFKHIMGQIHLSLISCFNALDSLCRTIHGRSRKRELVSQIVGFFGVGLDLLHSIGISQSKREDAQSATTSQEKRPHQNAEYAVNKYIARMLGATIYAFDWKVHQPGHSELLEGILFHIMKHNSRLLSQAVFAEHVALSKNIGNITSSIDVPPKSGPMGLEAYYMVQILYATLGGPDKKELMAKVLVAKDGPNVGIGLSALQTNEFSRSRTILQNALVEGALGGTNLQGLSLPQLPVESFAEVDNSEAMLEKYGSDWLIGALWGLIGWDLVS